MFLNATYKQFRGGGIQEDKFSDFNIAYVLVYNQKLINIYILRICALW